MPGNRGLFAINEAPRDLSYMSLDLGALQLAKQPPMINPEDDGFEGLTLSPKWINYNATVLDFTTMPGWLGTNGHILQPVQTTNWDIYTELIQGDLDKAAGYYYAGFALSSVPGSGGSQITFTTYSNTSLTSHTILSMVLSNWGYVSTPLNWTIGLSMDHIWLHLNKNGSTLSGRVSVNGYTYTKCFEMTMGFTPAYYGFYSNGMTNYFNYFVRR